MVGTLTQVEAARIARKRQSWQSEVEMAESNHGSRDNAAHMAFSTQRQGKARQGQSEVVRGRIMATTLLPPPSLGSACSAATSLRLLIVLPVACVVNGIHFSCATPHPAPLSFLL